MAREEISSQTKSNSRRVNHKEAKGSQPRCYFPFVILVSFVVTFFAVTFAHDSCLACTTGTQLWYHSAMSLYSPQCPVCNESFRARVFYKRYFIGGISTLCPREVECLKCQAKLKHNYWWWAYHLSFFGLPLFIVLSLFEIKPGVLFSSIAVCAVIMLVSASRIQLLNADE